MTAPPDPVLVGALTWSALDYSVVPVADDLTKRPAIMWKRYQLERAGADTIVVWYSTPRYGLGIVTGAISGQLELFEFEGRAVREGYVEAMRLAMIDHGQEELWATIGAYVEWTPSGGLHLYYRVAGVARPNTKLARRPSTPEELAEHPGAKIQVLIETRGEGGYVVVAPTPGTCHASGRPWSIYRGTPARIPTITEEQRDLLYAIASTLDQLPEPAVQTEPAPVTEEGADRSADTGLRPGDDYNARANWVDILAGWKCMRRIGHGYGWQRPGKNDRSISATTGTSADGVDRLYVFSSSTEFEIEVPYSKFAAYTHLNHDGDYSAAGKELKRQGYGDQTTRSSVADSIPMAVQTALASHSPTPPPSGPSLFATPDAATEPAPEPAAEATVEQPAAAADGPVMTNRLTDDGNANALIEQFGHDLRYCHERGRWLTWEGHRWRWEAVGGGRAREYAKATARALPDETGIKVWRNRSLSALGTTNTLTQASTDERIVVPIDDLDADGWVLNTPDGVIDLRTGKVGERADHALHTRSTRVSPDPGADRTAWLQFLDVTFESDQELVDYMQRLVGYSVTGYIGPHVLPFAYGRGGNGKGVFLEAIGKVLGDYFTTSPNGFLMAKQFGQHETEIARLAGARMVLCSEVNESDHFDEAKVKQLTGGDTLTARFMRQDHFSFAPTHHLWLMGNHKPGVTTGGHSFWRRCRLIPFLHEVPEPLIIDDLQGIFAREHGAAILSWVIDGAVEFHRRGLDEPKSVREATAEYARDQDTVGRFVDEMCLLSEVDEVRVEVGVLAAAYARWCEETGEEPVSGKRLGLDLQQRFLVRPYRSHGKRFHNGIALLQQEEESHRGQGRAFYG